MNQSNEFIEVLKLVASKKDGEQESYTPKKESIRVSDIKSFRRWHKSDGGKFDQVEGDQTVLYLKSTNGKDGGSIKISESEESFTERLGGVIRLNGNP